MLTKIDKQDAVPGFYLFWGAGTWDWAKVVADSNASGGMYVEHIDPLGQTDLRAPKDSYRDRSLRLKHKAITVFPYTLYGPVELPTAETSEDVAMQEAIDGWLRNEEK